MTAAGSRRLTLVAVLAVAAATAIGSSAARCISTATGAAPKATLATFAGIWYGHTRGLTVSRNGHAKESIGDGCCDPVINVSLRLSHPTGTAEHASATVRVRAVHVLDKSEFSKSHPAPHVGETGQLRLVNGVFIESLAASTYCDPKIDTKGVCGA